MSDHYDPRHYHDPKISIHVKKIRTRCHLSQESLKSIITNIQTSLPDFGQILSHLDVASNQLQLFEDEMSQGDVMLRQVAVPMQDVRDNTGPGIPIVLDSCIDQSTIENEYKTLEDSPFDALSKKQMDDRRNEYNQMINSVAIESKKFRRVVEDKLLMLKKKHQDEKKEKGIQSVKSSKSSSSSLSSTTLGKRQRESMQQGLDAFTFMKD